MKPVVTMHEALCVPLRSLRYIPEAAHPPRLPPTLLKASIHPHASISTCLPTLAAPLFSPPSTGLTDAQAMQMAKGLAVTGDLQAAADQIKGLYKLFDACDCTMVEVRH